jgi:hypothetical protein
MSKIHIYYFALNLYYIRFDGLIHIQYSTLLPLIEYIVIIGFETIKIAGE